MNLDLEKYTINSNIDKAINSLNQSKQMLEHAKTAAEIENAIVFAEYALSSLDSDLHKSHEKVKTR